MTEPVRLALDCLPDPTLVLDSSDKVVYTNKAYERMSGFASGEVVGSPLRHLAEPAGAPGLAMFQLKQGGPALVRIVVRPMAGQLGERFRLVRIDQEDMRRSVVEELTAGLDVRSEFMTRVSHEIRTPLTATQEGIAVVLEGLTGPLNEKQIEFLELARRNVQRLTRLVSDTLELGDLKRSGILESRPPANLDRLVQECSALYPEAECKPGSAVWARVDEARVRAVLERLIQNAVRHSGSPIFVAIREEDGQATVAVADSGPGIPADKLESVFDEFEQLSMGPGRTVGGVGLGLAIVKLVIEQHGGRVWAESEPGKGSCFYFSLKTCPPPVEKFHDHCELR